MNTVRWIMQGKRRVGACRTENAGAPALSPLRMLVVDDVDIHRAILSGMLKLLFHEATVDEAGDGQEALSKLKAQRYDVVLSDWLMPNMDGLELAAWLQGAETPPPPFVLISARDDYDEIAALFATPGIDGYLLKPHDQNAMREVIGSVLADSAPQAA